MVTAVRGSVRDLLGGKTGTGEFDFIYAAGLFDSLKEPLAKSLIRKMYDMLNPERLLLLASFADGLIDSGYLEAFHRLVVDLSERAGNDWTFFRAWRKCSSKPPRTY